MQSRTLGALLGLGLLSIVACTTAPPQEEPTSTLQDEYRASLYNTGGLGLNVRAKPNTQSAIIGSVRPNTSVDITCQTIGERIRGTNIWDYLAAYGGYVSDAHLFTGYDGFSPLIDRCDGSEGEGGGGGGGGSGAPQTNGYRLPLECGTTATVTQAHGTFSHTGQAYWGTDFGLTPNTPLVAIDDGVVSLVNSSVRPGDPCYSGGGPSCANTVNYVVIAHADGTDSLYAHINRALVSAGQTVRRGERIALSGGTGWSTGPHAHVQRQERCGIWWCTSMKVLYEDVPGGDPWAGASLTSQNCAAASSP